MTSTNQDGLDFDHLKVVSEDEMEEEDDDDDEAAVAAAASASSSGPTPTPTSGWRGRISSFLSRRNKGMGRLGVLVRVKRAEKLKEEAMFYGGGEVEEVRDDTNKRKRRLRRKRNKAPEIGRDTNKSSVVCLGFRDEISWIFRGSLT